MSRPIRKRSNYLLLELLIAFSLVISCFFPLLKPHRIINKKSHEKLEKMQLEREARLVFYEIKKNFFEYPPYSWKEIKEGLPPREHKSKYVENYTITFSTETKECCTKLKTKISYLLLDVHISCSREGVERAHFTFPLYVEAYPV